MAIQIQISKGGPKIHLTFFLRKICRGVLDVWNTKTYLGLELPIDPAHTEGATSFTFDPTIIICAIKPYPKNYR
jgi:hypothetical protein